MLKSSVADPDPNPGSPDPYAIGPPGYASFYSNKILDIYCPASRDFFSLKIDVKNSKK
jgi:hypothetical protein